MDWPDRYLYNAGSAVMTVSIDGIITSFNLEAERLLGDSAQDIIGKATPAIFHIQDEVFKRAEELSEELNEPVHPGFDVFVIKARKNLPNTYEWTYVRKDGSLLPVLLSVSALRNSNNDIYGYLGIITDVSQYKKKQKELEDIKLALDQHSIISNTDENGKITYVNDQFCTISKYSQEELIGQDYSIVNSRYHTNEFMRHLWETITSGKVWKGEIKNKAKDGSFYWVDATIVPFMDKQGKPYQYVSIKTVITDRKEREIDLLNKIEELKLIYEYKEIFNVPYDSMQMSCV